MPRDFRHGWFSSNHDMGEDVNPSAYVVNLVDCMLVLAVAFLVALISYWNVDINVTDLSDSELTEVDPDSLNEDLSGEGAYYVEAGTVYQDPQTGELYMVESGSSTESDSDNDSDSGASSTGGSESSSSGESASSGESTAGNASDDDVRASRAAGGD